MLSLRASRWLFVACFFVAWWCLLFLSFVVRCLLFIVVIVVFVAWCLMFVVV